MTRYALIAEPNPQRAAEYLALLAELGLDAVVTRDGVEAQATLQYRGPPALLVTELALPRMDGFALLTELRARTPRPSTTVLVATAFDELRLMAWPHRTRLGIHGFLDRRASAATLRETFRAALEGRPVKEPGPVALAPAVVPRPPVPAASAPERAESPDATPELTDVVAAVAEAFGVPVALLSLTEGEQRRTVAHVTLPRGGAGEPWDWSRFHLAVQAPEGLVVADLAKHPLLREEPLVRAGVVGCYAGAALVSSTGARIGTLCILDTRRRSLGTEELGVLVGLARRIAGELESKARARATEREAARLRGALAARDSGTGALELLAETLHAVDAGMLLVDGQGQCLVANERLAELLGVSSRELSGMSLEAVRGHLIGLSGDPGELRRRLEPSSGPSGTLAVTLELERPSPRVLRWVARPVSIPGGMGQLSTFTEVGPQDSAAPRARAVR